MLWPADAGRAPLAGSAPLSATLRAAAMPAQAVASAPDQAAPVPRRIARSVPEKPAVPAAGAVAAASPAAPSLSAGVAVASVGAAVASGPADGPDADGIRSYRIGLAREARSHRRYPPLALERGWTGTAEIQVDVSRQGRARQILLARSSGHEILDREAVAMMSHAAASAALPDSLRGQEFAVRLPVVFDLADLQ